MPKNPLRLIRDDDRDTAVERLRDAYAEGHITHEELDGRLGRALTARTRGELLSSLDSLPEADAGTTSTISAAAGRIQRRGAWRVPRSLKVASAFGRVHVALARPGAQTDALRDVFSSLMVFDEVNGYLRGMITGLDIRYPGGGDHPLAGRRVPDADLKTPDGATRVYELLHAARPVLLDLRGSAELAAAAEGWAGRVDIVEARSEDDNWTVPAAGEIPAPAALLIRPDGHVAWAAGPGGALDTSALRTALTTWFGPVLQG
ncbi:hypothetical protein GCM10011583_09040 [Streptomyces camponoticapitis]|uniref:DUF1707 domain-containing protein n=1 Tax=Streptomyces camponoticapitis TaxID=1616125 RepID=A0ABQ2E2H5_9ACTN|nr:hypothetical protein GCM10011583_09040 [Streptomyces camponoticapitis]